MLWGRAEEALREGVEGVGPIKAHGCTMGCAWHGTAQLGNGRWGLGLHAARRATPFVHYHIGLTASPSSHASQTNRVASCHAWHDPAPFILCRADPSCQGAVQARHGPSCRVGPAHEQCETCHAWARPTVSRLRLAQPARPICPSLFSQ